MRWIIDLKPLIHVYRSDKYEHELLDYFCSILVFNDLFVSGQFDVFIILVTIKCN